MINTYLLLTCYSWIFSTFCLFGMKTNKTFPDTVGKLIRRKYSAGVHSAVCLFKLLLGLWEAQDVHSYILSYIGIMSCVQIGKCTCKSVSVNVKRHRTVCRPLGVGFTVWLCFFSLHCKHNFEKCLSKQKTWRKTRSTDTDFSCPTVHQLTSILTKLLHLLE